MAGWSAVFLLSVISATGGGKGEVGLGRCDLSDEVIKVSLLHIKNIMHTM